MSITSFMRTLIATSATGRALCLARGDDIVKLTAVKDVSEQASAMTSLISAEFNRRGCCSLIHKRKRYERPMIP